MKSLILAIDFDGTIVESAWPNIGSEIPGSISSIQRLHKRGHKVIINTCRAGERADECRRWLDTHKVPYDAFNENLPDIIKRYDGDTRKISADLYIDDKGVFARNVRKRDFWALVQREVNAMSL